jgi:hypothetical protein
MGAIHASHHSEAAELRGRLCKLADGVRALEQRFKAAWSAARLGDVELPPRDNARTRPTSSPGCGPWVIG